MFNLPGKIYFVCAESASSLTARAIELLKQADLVVHENDAPAEALELVPARTAVHALNGHSEVGSAAREEIRKRMADAALHGQTVVFLTAGDSSSLAGAREEASALSEANAEVEIVPQEAAVVSGR